MRYRILLLFFFLVRASLAGHTTSFTSVSVRYRIDTVRIQATKRSPEPIKRQYKPIWKRVGKILLYIVAVLAMIYLLGLIVVAALASMGKRAN